MSVHPPHSLFLSRACIEAVEINGMCHPSLSALRARFHNIQCSWEVFPARLFPPTSGTGVFSLSLYTDLLILEQEIFFSLVASVPIFLFFPTSSVLSLFLSNPAYSVPRPWNTPLRVCFFAVSIFSVPQASWDYFGMQCDWRMLSSPVARICVASRWLLCQACVLSLVEGLWAGSSLWEQVNCWRC